MRAPSATSDGRPAARQLSSRSYLAALLGAGGLIIVVIVALVGGAVLQGRADAHRTAETVTNNLSKALADRFTSDLNRIDIGILDILDEVARQRAGKRWDDAAINAAIARQDGRHPDLIGFRIYDADGRLRHGVSNIVNRNSNIGMREDFVYLRDHPDVGLLVAPPVFGNAAQQWLIGPARRIDNPDGSFGGAVYGALPVSSLARNFSDLDLGVGGTVALYHQSMRMAARYPEAKTGRNPVGTVTVSDQLRAILQSGADLTNYDYNSVVDGVARTASVRKIPGQPYFVLVGLAEDDYLMEWRRNSLRLALFGSLAVALVAGAMSGLYRHIAERQRATANLAESEAKLRALFEMSPLGIARNTMEGRFIEMNAAYRQITGYDEAELLALDLLALTPARYKADETRHQESLRTEGRYGPYVKEYQRRDGTLVPVELRGVVVTGGDGIPYIWSLVEDITARNRWERQMAFYQALIEYTSDCVYVISPARGFKLVFVNDAACRHWGLEREKLLEWRMPDWDPNFRTAESLENLWRETKARKNHPVTTVHRVASGRLVPVEVSGNYLVLDGEEYLAGYFRDISERIAAENALKERSELLSQSNADLEQFAYVASHDLQTPLRNIVSYTQLLERRYKGQLDADADDFIGFIVDSTKRMTRLITDLLEYSRVASQSAPLGPVAAGQAMRQAVLNLRLDMEEAKAEVTVGDLPTVLAEETRLVRLFQNLLSNAVKYRAPGRPPRVSATATREANGELWRFAIADNGIGIEPQYFDKIFAIFQRLNPAFPAKGTGIGLTLCRRIVHRFGGTIWVDSSPDQGTTFFFTLRDANGEATDAG